MKILLNIFLLLFALNIGATEYHIAKSGKDNNAGTSDSPLLTIQAAANIAVAGDTITVHEGIYRERVDPINGGTSDLLRIVYRAAEGERVVIKGSEIVDGWEKVERSVWKAVVPNYVFKGHNPYSTCVEGDWFLDAGIKHHTGEVYLNGRSLFEQNSLDELMDPRECEWAVDKASSLYAWYAEVDDKSTTIWANFQDINPNKALVEINAREACFYPSVPGRNFITINGFEMSQSATQWAPPTSEQPGLIGTHWSRAWIIENNIISSAKFVGISLGKDRATGHNILSTSPGKDGATSYNEVIFSALEAGWSKEKTGSHIVRNNVIYDCGQAGVVGSLGAAFSEICNNHIYNIYTKRNYTGHEMAGIKLHAAIDVLIEKNRIHNSHCGIWLDWMAQGARVTRNIIYDNDQYDYHDEVNHGPLMVDHNLFLSEVGISLMSRSEGTAFVHNLFAGRSKNIVVKMRTTPYHRPHSTRIKGIRNIHGGDMRFYNNIFLGTNRSIDISGNRQIKGPEGIGVGLGVFNKLGAKSYSEGNVFYKGAEPYEGEENSIEVKDYEPTIKLIESEGDLIVQLNFDSSPGKVETELVDSRRLGEAKVSEAPYVKQDNTYYYFDTDFLGNDRNIERPLPGPFENLNAGLTEIRFSQKLSK